GRDINIVKEGGEGGKGASRLNFISLCVHSKKKKKGLYLQLLVTHLFFDRHLKDFWVMLTHHILTIVLIICSYGWGYLRVGAVIMWVHDWSDPILNIAKLFRYCGLENVSSFLFAILILSWIGTRLLFFLTHCVFAVAFAMPKDTYYEPFHHIFFQVPLYFLYILHWYWLYLMLSVMMNAILIDLLNVCKKKKKKIYKRDQKKKKHFSMFYQIFSFRTLKYFW
ncbi:ceramide synthase 2, partial [Reticulomyxa filosa]